MRFIVLVVLFLSGLSTTIFSQETLRKYADQIGLNIGVAMGTQFDMNNQAHNNLVKAEFNTVVAENSMKAQNIHPSKGRTNFNGPDKLVKFAQDNNMKVRGHTLVWHSQNAGWITTGSRAAVLENMKYHIETVMGHFKGKIFQWDVVNEAFEEFGPNLRNSAWLTSVGEDFIDSAFAFAHRVDPDAKLFYNDYSTSTVNAKSTAIYNKLKKMIQNGIPVHGVGFQSHQSTSDGNSTLYSKVKENFQRFADLGLEIAITELDAKGSDFDAQAKVYSAYMQVALEMEAVTTYVIWGVRDQDSWVNPTPLIFDNSFKPKKAYNAILELLKAQAMPSNFTLKDQKSGIAFENGFLLFDNLRNTLTLAGVEPGKSKLVEFFNLAGEMYASRIVTSGKPLSVSSMNIPAGTVLIRTDKQVMKFQMLH